MTMYSPARAMRMLVSLCFLFPLFAFASGSTANDARVVWLTLPGSLLKVTPADGSVALQLPALKQPGALAVEGTNDTVWVYGQKAVVAFDHSGNTLITVDLPHNFHGGTPQGMAVDNSAGNIWIAIQKELYCLDMGGTVKADLPLAGNATALSLDTDDSQVWVAEQNGIEVFDTSGNRVRSIAQSTTNPPTAIAYDANLKQTWVLYTSSVARYDASGNQTLSAALASDLGSVVAPDGQGGAWVGGQQNLARLDTTGTAQFVIQPFAGLSGGNALGLVSDAVDHSAWVANSLHLRHYGTSGDFLLEAVLPVGPGNGNGMQQLGYFVDTTPPTISITAPTNALWTNKNQLPITLTYSDDTGVDPSSVQVTGNGNPLAVTCQVNSDNSGASCTPNSPLPDGGYSLSITVADYAGNVSKPATVSFNVLTVPPTITVTNPSSPYTNQPNLTVTGSVNQPGTLTIDGATVPMAADGSFNDAVTLMQGDNSLSFVATDLADNVTTITKTVNLNTIPPIPVVNGDISVTGPTNGQVTVTGKAGSAAPNVSVTITDTKTGASVTVTSDATGAFTATLAAGSNDSLQISEQDKWGNVTTDPNPIAISNLPPDPVSVAPSLDQTIFTTYADQTSFLYSGSNPIQTGVQAGTIVAQRAAVIRGKVMDVSGNPLPGVTITILNHPEFGQTLSRTDGMFDMAVNGGGYLIVNYSIKGYLPAQRQTGAIVLWNGYINVDDVALIQPDPVVTPVAFGTNAPAQLAQGSVVTDDDGTRQATVYFPAGTSATMVMPDGSTQPFNGGGFRATEYTVGKMGQTAMPAALPGGTAYTYAVELSFDEAQAAGAVSVSFSQPVPAYLNNFLNLPAGAAVPAFYYDRVQGKWLSMAANGDVLKVLGLDASGNAVLDVDGTGIPATSAELTKLGITTAELAQISQLYKVGSSFWRFALAHFCTDDWNLAQGPVTLPLPQIPLLPPIPDNPLCLVGCEISAQTQGLGNTIPLAGTPFALHYDSRRQDADIRTHVIKVQILGATVPANLAEVKVRFQVAGQSYDATFANPTPNLMFQYYWDGTDIYGRPIIGAVEASIQVGYVLNPIDYRVLKWVDGTVYSFNSPVPTDRIEINYGGIYGFPVIGFPAPKKHDVAGWSLTNHDTFDATSSTLYRGDGTTLHGSNVSKTITVMAGGGILSGTGHPATQTSISVSSLAAGPDGTVYFAGSVSGVGSGVYMLDSAGNIQPLVESANTIMGIALSPTGDLYYGKQVSSSHFQIFKLKADGTSTWVAGCPAAGPCANSGPAQQLNITSVENLAFGPDGTLYLSDVVNNTIRSVHTDGTATSVVTFGGNSLGDVGVGPDGSIYYAGRARYGVFRRYPDGREVYWAGGHGQGSPSNGVLATSTSLTFPSNLAVGSDGTVSVADNNNIRNVNPADIITTVGGGGTGAVVTGAPSVGAFLTSGPVAIMPNGDVITTANNGVRLVRITNTLSGIPGDAQVIPMQDGKTLEAFDINGRHLKTLNSVTQATLYSFGYDVSGNLVSVTDAVGRQTTIQRDSSGNPLSITSPDGQVTTMTVDNYGFMTSLADPAGDTYHMTSNVDGLLLTYQDPNGNKDNYSYDLGGLLTSNTNSVNGGWTLNEVDGTTPGDYTVTAKSASGLARIFAVNNLSGLGLSMTDTEPDGTVSATVTNTAANSQTDTAADGTVTTMQYGPDPRFGGGVKLPATVTVKTPSGITSKSTLARTAALSNPINLFSFTSIVDTLSVNGNNFVDTFIPITHEWTAVTPVGRKSVTTIDSLDRPASVQIGSLNAVNYSYDAAGHLQTISSGTGTAARTVQYTYYADGPSRGYLQQVQDAMGRTVGYQYDTAGRVTLETLPDGNQIGFGYDANGNLASLTPPSRPAHGFDYDGIDEVQDYTPPAVAGVANPATHYSYNLDRQLTEVDLPDGQQIRLGYDTGGRLGTVTLPTGLYGYTYKPVTGQLQSITAPDAEDLAYTWDGSLNTGSTWSGPVVGTVTGSYNNNFRVTGVSVNGSAIAYGYDNDGLLTAAGNETIKRDVSDGLITGTALGAVTTTETYDSFGETQTDTAKFSSTTVYSVTYTRDNLGRITGKTETINGTGHSYSYGYDQQGRLDSATLDSTATTYGYDANGNRLQVNGTTVATYDDQDRLLTYGSSSYSYTANGELLTKNDGTGTTSYTYDVIGNLLEVKLPSGTDIQYVVDGQNRRVGKKVTGKLVQGFLYQDQLAPVAELDGSGNLIQRYVYGSRSNVPDYIIQGSNTYRVITDQLGSPTLVVDAIAGTVVEQIDYDAWGNVINDSNPGFQPFGYAGGLYDQDTKLVRFGKRDYDAYISRWTSKDPLIFAGGETSLYGYVGNNPIDLIDPTGLAVQGSVGFGGAIIVPGFGISGSFSLGANFDGWNTSFYIQDQFNAGEGMGAFAGYGGQFGGSNGPAPDTGFDSGKYGEVDAGLGPGAGLTATRDKCGNLSLGGNSGFPRVRFGEGVGLGALVGKAYTATAVTPTLGQIFNRK